MHTPLTLNTYLFVLNLDISCYHFLAPLIYEEVREVPDAEERDKTRRVVTHLNSEQRAEMVPEQEQRLRKLRRRACERGHSNSKRECLG